MNARHRGHVMRATGLLMALVPLAATGQGLSIVPAQKPYTLMIRYGDHPCSRSAKTPLPGANAQPGEEFLRAARHLDIGVDAMDAGRVATHDVTLTYRIEASREAPTVIAGIDLAYSHADGESQQTTHVRLPRNRWVLIAASTSTSTRYADARCGAAYVRLKPR